MAFRSLRTGGYSPSEQHLVIVGNTYTNAMAGPVLIYLHGAGGNGAIDGDDIRSDLEAYADRGYVVGAPLAGGGVTWGNATFTAALDAYLVYLASTWGADTSRVTFVGDSHGAPCFLNWAVENPTRLKSAVMRVPAVEMQYMHDNNIVGVAAGMETSYTNLAGLVAAYPTHDPSHPTFQATFRAASIAGQVRFMYNEGDPVVRASGVRTVAAACGIEAVRMLGPSHAPWGHFNIYEQLDWLRGHG